MRGDQVPAYVTWGAYLVTGTHRCAASELLELLGRPERAPSVDIEDLDAAALGVDICAADLDALRQELRDSVESEFPRQAEDALREYPGVA